MVVLRYQVLHIGAEKSLLFNTLQVVQYDLKQYENLVKRLRMKHKERKTLLEERSSLSMLRVLRHRELAQKITTLTETIEELKSEKAFRHLQATCRKKLDSRLLTQSQKDVADLLGEVEKLVSIREGLRQLQRQPNQRHHRKEYGQER